MNHKIIAFFIAFAGLVGCLPPPAYYAAAPTSINMPTASVVGPNVGGQLGTVPVGAMVVTSNGYVYRRGLPVANMYRPSSPMAAQLRAEGETLAQQDSVAAAAGASQAPTAPTSGGTTGSTDGGTSVDQRLNSMATQQVQLHHRVSCLENPHAPNCR